MDWLLRMLHHSLFLLSRLSNSSQENIDFSLVPFNAVSSVLSTFRSYPMPQISWNSSAIVRMSSVAVGDHSGKKIRGRTSLEQVFPKAQRPGGGGVLGQVADNKGGTGQERLSDMARRSSASSMAMTPSTAMHTVAAPMSCRFCLGLS